MSDWYSDLYSIAIHLKLSLSPTHRSRPSSEFKETNMDSLTGKRGFQHEEFQNESAICEAGRRCRLKILHLALRITFRLDVPTFYAILSIVPALSRCSIPHREFRSTLWRASCSNLTLRANWHEVRHERRRLRVSVALYVAGTLYLRYPGARRLKWDPLSCSERNPDRTTSRERTARTSRPVEIACAEIRRCARASAVNTRVPFRVVVLSNLRWHTAGGTYRNVQYFLCRSICGNGSPRYFLLIWRK